MIRKRILFISLLFLSLALHVNGQNKEKGFNPERYQADLEKYIVRKAGLTQKESAAFLPLYREMKTKMRSVFEANHNKVNITSDAECKKLIQQRDANEIQMKKIQQQYHNKFLKILPASKVFKLIKEEENFHRYSFNKALENMNRKGNQQKRNDNRNRNK